MHDRESIAVKGKRKKEKRLKNGKIQRLGGARLGNFFMARPGVPPGEALGGAPMLNSDDPLEPAA